MTARQPYSRVYWAIVDDPKFIDVYDNDRRLATWLRLLLIADQAHPASPHIPAGIHRPSFDALVTAGLVVKGTGNRYHIHGLDAERARRWGTRGTDDGPEPDPNGAEVGPKPDRDGPSRAGDTRDETRRDEERRDENTARAAAELDGDEAALFGVIARGGAFIRPDSPLGIRLVALVDRRGAAAVLAEARKMTPPLSDRQWVLGLENRLEKIPTGADARTEDVEAERQKRNERIQRDMWKRRVEAYRHSGQWDEAWGAPPEAVA